MPGDKPIPATPHSPARDSMDGGYAPSSVYLDVVESLNKIKMMRIVIFTILPTAREL
jgi:hypothetical protein